MKRNQLSGSLILLVLCISCEYGGGLYPTSEGDIGGEEFGENYNEFSENPFQSTEAEPISTFSIDADGASYSNTRRFLTRENSLPPRGALRTEEVINFFPLDYPEPTDGRPVSVHGEVSGCPWNEETRIVRVGIKGRTLSRNAMPSANWVLLADVSGSMSDPDKLGLLQEGFHAFVDEMKNTDRLAIVTYAGSDKVALKSTSGREKDKIHRAIDRLSSGGSTAGADGILTAYEIAEENFIFGGNNRIIIGTDGDFNVGPSSQEELVDLIEENRDRGIFLTVLGYGTGNLNEGMMEQLANNGNGNFEYIDSEEQSDKVFRHEFGKFYTVAKDVKVQVEWNPDVVEEYRLIGYENRLLETDDFEDDTKDAGEIGSGQNVTALYEIKPKPGAQLRGQRAFTFRFRYKHPDWDQSQEFSVDIADEGQTFEEATENHRFVTTLTAWAMLMWDSEYKEGLKYQEVMDWGAHCISYDPQGYRQEWLNDLVPQSQQLDNTDP
ncbi:MAG TPA: VWA domain-containing protein [Cytophagales bacterium]|nr:VWA domain-containing protein [Cytophagales bacterium]HAA21201.1 VWA domain-containing protein [Cytophagales bacterium]HAP60249.1 VWA domain-containing protein [Cytophagales bacterium]